MAFADIVVLELTNIYQATILDKTGQPSHSPFQIYPDFADDLGLTRSRVRAFSCRYNRAEHGHCQPWGLAQEDIRHEACWVEF